MTDPEALAAKIEAKAAETLAALDREMTIMRWPAEFRTIMWDAVAHEAMNRSANIRDKNPSKEPTHG